MKEVHSGIELRQSGRAALHKQDKPILICLLSLAAAALAVLILWPAAREGAKALCNMLFDASEKVNAYAYDRFAVSDSASPAAAILLLGLAAAALCAAAVFRRSRAAAVGVLLVLACAEIYFGVTLPLLLNLLLFVLPGLLLLRKTDLRTGGFYVATVLVLLLLFSASMPGVDARLEAASEIARDRLDRVEQTINGVNPVQQPEETQKTHQENRLDEQSAAFSANGSENYHEYRLEQELEQEISKPQRINYFKIALIVLLILLLLLAPFLPFALLDSRRRTAQKRRAAFRSQDCAEAIRAMFLHVNAYLESCGLTAENRQFSDRADDIANRWSAEYAVRYEQAAALWQEAAYSGHVMTRTQCGKMREILDETEKIVYDTADRKTKLRLKYIECLHA